MIVTDAGEWQDLGFVEWKYKQVHSRVKLMLPAPPRKAPYSFRVMFMSAPEYDPHTDVEPGPEARNMEIAEHLLSTAFQLRVAGSFEEAEPLFLQALNVY